MLDGGRAGLRRAGAARRAALLDAALPGPQLVPARNGLPVLLSIPHSGRDYPAWLLAEARHGRHALASLEDPLVDRLAWRALAGGFGAVIARTPRGAVDCNRSPEEVDPLAIRDVGASAVGPRARHGLGIVPSRTHRHGLLWKRPLARERFEARLAAAYAPYHELIEQRLVELQRAHGTALLLDLHSMPPRGTPAPPVVIGNRHMTSSAEWLAREAVRVCDGLGFAAALNAPYAGGHIVERHGRPEAGLHALQIELDRSEYLAADLMSAGRGFDRASRLIEALATTLGRFLAAAPEAEAAE